MADFVKLLGDRVRQLRKDRGLSQEQLGELSGLHVNYIGQIERGEKNLTVESLLKVTSGLRISLEELFRYLDPMKSKDELAQITEMLVVRPASDHAMVLDIIKSVFMWESDKHDN